ncbi:hypothetical protein Hanom_Chr09g00824711 [Helianthus anomalus]
MKTIKTPPTTTGHNNYQCTTTQVSTTTTTLTKPYHLKLMVAPLTSSTLPRPPFLKQISSRNAVMIIMQS